MRTWYYVFSDPHYGHNAMHLKGYRGKGFEHKINSILRKLPKNKNTVFICLGDFSFYKHSYWHEEYFKITGGYKNWLIKGNHDKKSYSWYLDHGWDFVAESVEVELHNKRVLLTHRPQEHLSDDVDYNIHGHLHEKTHRGDENNILTNKHILVSMELDNYKIDTLQRIIQVKGEG